METHWFSRNAGVVMDSALYKIIFLNTKKKSEKAYRRCKMWRWDYKYMSHIYNFIFNFGVSAGFNLVKTRTNFVILLLLL